MAKAYLLFFVSKNFLRTLSKYFRKCVIGSLVLIPLLLIGHLLSAQNVGDYRTRNAGNWSATNTVWERWNGSNWVQPVTEGYPGQNPGTGHVIIRDIGTVTLDVSPAHAIGALTIEGGANSSILSFSGVRSLVVNGPVVIDAATTVNKYKSLQVNEGTLTCHSIQINGGGCSSSLVIRTGSVNVAGDVNMTTNGGFSYILFWSGYNGILSINGSLSGGNITSSLLDEYSYMPPVAGTVHFNNPSDGQVISPYTFYNLKVSGGDKVLNSNIAVNNAMTLDGSIIQLGDFNLSVGSENASNAIVGTFDASNMVETNGSGLLTIKNISSGTPNVVFPVGSNGIYAPVKMIDVGSAESTDISVRSVSGDLGPHFLQRYWDLTASANRNAIMEFSFGDSDFDETSIWNSYSAFNGSRGGDWHLSEGTTTLGTHFFSVGGASNNLQTTPISFSAGAVHLWEGSFDHDWNNAANWREGIMPSAGSNVIIHYDAPNHAPFINGELSLRYLKISKGDFFAKSGSQVTVNGNIDVGTSGNLIIEHDLGGSPASFIHKGTATGDVSVHVTYPALARNWYLGHPVTTNSRKYFEKGAYSVWSFAHLADKEEWTVVADNAAMTDPTQAFVVNNGTGAIQTVEHKGALASGSPSFTLIPEAKYRWNLVANPFNGYLNPMGLDFSNIEPTIWYRTVRDLSYQFVTYNQQEDILLPYDGSFLISPMQAFWVRAVNSGSLVFDSQALVHPGGSNPNIRGDIHKDDVLYLVLGNDKTSDQTAIACRLSGSTAYIAGDSEKRLSTGVVPNLYSLKSGKTTAINIQPEMPAAEGVALGYSIGTGGNIGLSIRALNIGSFLPGMSVYLEDRTTGARIDLRTNPEYAFTSDPMTNNSRFVLKFEKISTGVEDEVVGEQKGERIRIYGQQDKAIVLVGSELLRQGNARVNIYNLAGSLMSTNEVSDTRSEITLPAAPAIYLVEVEAGGQVKREKVVK